MSLAASIIIRTLNEAKWLDQVLTSLARQNTPSDSYEIILVDSGSADSTVAIAEQHGCRIVRIHRNDFTFGRSLNLGCAAARGRNLVFISGHCIPANRDWLSLLISPLERGTAHYAYGRQLGHAITRFSERQVFAKYFPSSVAAAQGGFFCNNANAALRADIWSQHQFDEDLTGLEDMELAKRLLAAGCQIAYVPEAPVFHIHEERWRKIRLRYEREAIALQRIMPEIHIHFSDFLRYFVSGCLHDASVAVQDHSLLKALPGILMFRFMQYWGSYRGNNDHHRLSRRTKERYFYPK